MHAMSFRIMGFGCAILEGVAWNSSEASAIVYRRYLTSSQLRQLKVGVNRVRAVQHSWHFIFFNCNDFVGEMAEVLHLRRPPSLMLPTSYVAVLRALNGPSSSNPR